MKELAQWDGYVFSTLRGVEVIRASARYGNRYERDARDFLESVALLLLDDDVLDEAAALRPERLRTLDALHLGTALVLRDEIGLFVTYDQQLADAAAKHGLVGRFTILTRRTPLLRPPLDACTKIDRFPN